MSDRTQQLLDIRELLRSHCGFKFSEVGMIVRRIPLPKKGKEKQKYRELAQSERDRSASDCKIMLATYQMMDLGTDIPSLSGLIYATPHSEIVQSKGRIERFLTGKKNPILVDIVDSFYPDCVGWGIERERQYRKEGLKISRIN